MLTSVKFQSLPLLTFYQVGDNHLLKLAKKKNRANARLYLVTID